MTGGRAGHLGSWLLRLVAWDGLLPAGIAVLPGGLRFAFPNNRALIELTALALPIAGFFLRFRIGMGTIRSNRCSPAVRGVQSVCFSLGILLLVFLDAVVVLSQVMPRGALVATSTDLLVLGCIAFGYLALMAVAMYPGRPLASDRPPLHLPPGGAGDA